MIYPISKTRFVVWCNGRFYRRPGAPMVLSAGLYRPSGPPIVWPGSSTPETYCLRVDGVVVFSGDQIRIERGRRYPDVEHFYIGDSSEVT